MRCEEAQEALLCDASPTDALRAHLASCSGCAALQAAFGSLRAPPPPASLQQRVMEELERQGALRPRDEQMPAAPFARKGSMPARRSDPLRWLSRVAAAGAILSYGGLALWMTSLHLDAGALPLPVTRRVESASDARQRAWLIEQFGAEGRPPLGQTPSRVVVGQPHDRRSHDLSWHYTADIPKGAFQ